VQDVEYFTENDTGGLPSNLWEKPPRGERPKIRPHALRKTNGNAVGLPAEGRAYLRLHLLERFETLQYISVHGLHTFNDEKHNTVLLSEYITYTLLSWPTRLKIFFPLKPINLN